jgi:hypothetical protein
LNAPAKGVEPIFIDRAGFGSSAFYYRAAAHTDGEIAHRPGVGERHRGGRTRSLDRAGTRSRSQPSSPMDNALPASERLVPLTEAA